MGVEWLNYHHLYYFWLVGKTGSVTRAAKQLRLAHPTISGQIHRLEDVLGHKLFVRSGRNLVLSDIGAVAFRYADEIFNLGGELQHALAGRSSGVGRTRVVVGVSDVIAKSIVHRMLEPAFALGNMRVVCREARSADAFFPDLAAHTVDVVLSDAPAGPGAPVRMFSHPLGECGTSFFATPRLARKYRPGFPRSLDGAPLLLPGLDSTFRRALNTWLGDANVAPTIVAELDDLALASVLGEEGLGIFAAADVLAAEVKRRYRVQLVGQAADIRQRFYAISVERKVRHPAVSAICETARRKIFG
jgi:LysR family transcriptional activator of nhaA